MSEERLGGFTRIFEIIIGLILISFSATVYLLTEAWLALMVILLGVGLFLLGVSRMFKGYREKFQPRWQRVLNFIFGIILVVTSLLALVYWPLGGLLWVIILAITLLAFGLNMLITGIFSAAYTTWHRAFAVIIGAVVLVLGGFVMISPTVAQFLLTLIIAAGLLIGGIYLLMVGITGSRAMLDRIAN